MRRPRRSAVASLDDELHLAEEVPAERPVVVAQEQLARGAHPLDHGLEERAVGPSERMPLAQAVHPPAVLLLECGVFALGNCLAEVQEAVVRDGVLCLETSSSYAHRVLGQNIAVVTSLVEDVTGFHGKVEVLLKQVEEDTHDPLLDTLAKAFRGQIIMERDEEGR